MKRSYHIAEGEIVQCPATGTLFRILFLMRDKAIIFNMDAPVGPKSIPPSKRKQRPCDLQSLGRSEELKPALPEFEAFSELIGWPKVDFEPDIRNLNAVTEAEERFIKRASAVVEFLHKDEPDIYFPHSRTRLIAAAVELFKLSPQTVIKYARSYWRAGKEISALHSGLSNCGAPGEMRTPGQCKLGRPRAQLLLEKHGVGVNVLPADQPYIKRAIEWYRAKPEKTLEDAYFWMLSNQGNYSRSLVRPDGSTYWGVTPGDVMTLEQFEYHSGRYFSASDRGRRAAEKGKSTKMPRSRHFGSHATSPEVGQIGEIDALHANFSLVAVNDRSLVIGGVVVFIMIDYASGLILGFSVGWDGESYEVFVDALVKCVTDKVTWCAEYGIAIEPEDWPARHWPQHLHADRGSAFMSNMADRVADAMRPNPFGNTPPMTPEAKGGVENTVKLVKLVFSRRYPGTWLYKVGHQKRGVPSPHYQAVMTRPEFTRAVMLVVLEVNQKVREGAATNPQLVARGIPKSSVAIFNDALNTHRHRLRKLEPIQLEAALLPRFKAKVSDKGICLSDELYYLPDNSSDLASSWYQKLVLDNAKVELAMNRETVNGVLLCLPLKAGGYIRCSLSPRSLLWANMSLREVQMTRSKQNELNKVEMLNQLPERVARAETMQRDGDEARAKTKDALGGVPFSERDIGSRRENRRQERAFERQKPPHRDAGGLPSPSTPNMPTENSFDYPDVEDE